MAILQTQVIPSKKIRPLREKLRRWYGEFGRDLPWRRIDDPYAALVAEFMLQQTTVAAVTPYFDRWMRRFPTVRALAKAEEHEVLELWQGLGYYSRGRNLLRAARGIVTKYGGQVPADPAKLRDLPGIGSYTAAAVAAFAFDRPVAAIDANIARVLARIFDIREPIDKASGKALLRAAGEAMFEGESGGRLLNSALMDLGATVCRSGIPACEACPVRSECASKFPETLPVKKERPAVEKLSDRRAFVFRQGRVWLEKSDGPHWKGLWMMPRCKDPVSPADHTLVYPITRYRVTLNTFDLPRLTGANLEGFPPDALPPMPSPHRRAVAAMLAKVHTEL